MINEDLQVFRRIDGLHLHRRNNHMLHATRLHPFKKLLVQGPYAQTGQQIVRAVLSITNKAYRTIRCVTGRTKHLGNRYTRLFGTINHHFRTTGIQQGFHNRLHADTQHKEKHKSYRHVDHEHGIEHRMMTGGQMPNEIHQQQEPHRGYVGQKHFDGINEGGIPQDTRIGMECPEHQHLHGHHQKILIAP